MHRFVTFIRALPPDPDGPASDPSCITPCVALLSLHGRRRVFVCDNQPVVRMFP
jgi:hypothetical protein